MTLQKWPHFDSYRSCSQRKLVKNGDEFRQAILDLIDKAQVTLHLQMYIFLGDNFGQLIAEKLQSAAQRNVTIYILLDAFGSMSLSSDFIERYFINPRIHFSWFNKAFTFKNLGWRRRLHLKVLCADQSYALVGGMNIGEKFNTWPDFALWVEGPIVESIHKSCHHLWKSNTKTIKHGLRHLLDHHNDRNRLSITPSPPYTLSLDHTAGPVMRIRENDWVNWKEGIYKSYLQAFRHSQESITIVGSYFLPERKIKRALEKAAERGVKIKLLFTHVSDVPIVTKATHFIYRPLLKKGMEIYEWIPSVVHGKLAVVDHKWLTIGSYNLNDLLGYSTVELNIDAYDPPLAQEVESQINLLIEQGGKKISLDDWEKSETIYQRFLSLVSYYCLKILLRLLLLFSSSKPM